MKTIKLILMSLLLVLSMNFLEAQCSSPLGVNAITYGSDVQYLVYIGDSANVFSDYYWEFSNGDTIHQMNPMYVYTQSGTYTACFHYVGSLCSGDSCYTTDVDICDFNLGIGFVLNQLAGTFWVSNPQPDFSYSWTFFFNNGAQFTSTDSIALVTFPDWGIHSVQVVVTTTAGCSDTSIANVNIHNPCTANIYSYPTGGTAVQFYSSPFDSLNPSTFTYLWNFDGIDTSTTAYPAFDFGSYGTYNICLSVTGPNCYDSICKLISISPPPPPTYSIYGTVSNGGSGACDATVYLIVADTVGHLSLLNQMLIVDSFCTGTYHFNSLPAGTYYVKAALNSSDAQYANYLPTYIGDELLWANATPVSISNSNLSNQDIHLIAGINQGGPGFIGGWVTLGAGLIVDGNNEERGIGDPLPNVQINLLTDNDVPVAYTYTDVNGRYTFGNLALGTYKVYAEEINKVPYPTNVTLTANNPSQDNVNVSINSNSTTTGIDDLRDIYVERVFPNPVSNKTTLTLSLKQNSNVKMMLSDVNGKLLQLDNLNLHKGLNKITVDLTNESTGMYHLSLLNNHTKRIISLIKVK